MTEKTQEQCDAEAEAFVKLVADNLPDSLRGEDIVRVCGILITTYGATHEALEWTKVLIASLAKYYVEGGEGECDCPKCTENRRAMAH